MRAGRELAVTAWVARVLTIWERRTFRCIGASRRIPAEGLRRYVARLTPAAADQGPRTAGTRRPKQQPLWE